LKTDYYFEFSNHPSRWGVDALPIFGTVRHKIVIVAQSRI
jgi:hypothetical protein